MILLCMVGAAMEDVAKQAGVAVGNKVASQVLKALPREDPDRHQQEGRFPTADQIRRAGPREPGQARAARRRRCRRHGRRHDLLRRRSSRREGLSTIVSGTLG